MGVVGIVIAAVCGVALCAALAYFILLHESGDDFLD